MVRRLTEFDDTMPPDADREDWNEDFWNMIQSWTQGMFHETEWNKHGLFGKSREDRVFGDSEIVPLKYSGHKSHAKWGDIQTLDTAE